MMLFRCAKLRDLNDIYKLSIESGHGLTTLPADEEVLHKRLQWAADSFRKNATTPLDEYYLFVLEDPNSGKVVGTSALEANVGHDIPSYSYKISNHVQICHPLKIRKEFKILNLVNDLNGRSELCTLYLHPDYRRNFNGPFLSKARFLFLREFQERFSHQIIAEMRGESDDDGNSPFWKSIAEHFFAMSFTDADYYTISTNKQFIADLMPKLPIYANLLSEEAQECIGKPHIRTIPAMNLLLGEGFSANGYVDIFDAGPTIEADVKWIKTFNNSQLLKVSDVSSEESGKNLHIITNAKPDFKATLNNLTLINNEECVIHADIAKLLEISKGDQIRVSHFDKNFKL